MEGPPGARHGAAQEEALQEEQEAAGGEPAGHGERHRDDREPWGPPAPPPCEKPDRVDEKGEDEHGRDHTSPPHRGSSRDEPRQAGHETPARGRAAVRRQPAGQEPGRERLPDREGDERDDRADREAHGERVLPALAREGAERAVGDGARDRGGHQPGAGPDGEELPAPRGQS